MTRLQELRSKRTTQAQDTGSVVFLCFDARGHWGQTQGHGNSSWAQVCYHPLTEQHTLPGPLMFQKVAHCTHSGPGVSPRGPELPFSKGKVTKLLRRAQQQQNKHRLTCGFTAARDENPVKVVLSLTLKARNGTCISHIKIHTQASVTPREAIECDNEVLTVKKNK